MQNGNGGAYCLTTFLVPDDLCTIPAADFAHDILATTLQDSPLNLLCPKFNCSSAKTDSTIIEAEISSKIFCLATPSPLDHLFNQLCPGYSEEPHTTLNHIWQTYEDASGNAIFWSVYDITLRFLPSPTLLWIRKFYQSASARPSWMALTVASMPVSALTSPTTASHKNVPTLTSAVSFKKCSSLLYAPKQSIKYQGHFQ
jgi:hypothetical protein